MIILAKKVSLYLRLRKGGVAHSDAVHVIKNVCLPDFWLL